MNKMLEETVKNMIQQGERTGKDYIGEDGLLYCGQCHEIHAAWFPDYHICQKAGKLCGGGYRRQRKGAF